jgi:hypothetical protein
MTCFGQTAMNPKHGRLGHDRMMSLFCSIGRGDIDPGDLICSLRRKAGSKPTPLYTRHVSLQRPLLRRLKSPDHAAFTTILPQKSQFYADKPSWMSELAPSDSATLPGPRIPNWALRY